MALDNYANLKQSIKLWSHREDVVGEIVADAITMAEQEIFYGENPLRMTEMITESTTTATTQEVVLPDGLVELISISILIDDCYHLLESVPRQLLTTTLEGTPKFYTIKSGVVFDVIPDKPYTIKFNYFKKPAPLSDEAPTNIALSKYPMAYLFGGVAMAMMYAGEEDRMNEYVIRMRDVISNANSSAENIQYGALPNVLIDGVIP